MTHDKRDANERSLVALWRKAGCVCIQQARTAGFDLVVICPKTGVHLVEVKSGTKKLTVAEQVRQGELEALGARYEVIRDEAQAQAMIRKRRSCR